MGHRGSIPRCAEQHVVVERGTRNAISKDDDTNRVAVDLPIRSLAERIHILTVTKTGQVTRSLARNGSTSTVQPFARKATATSDDSTMELNSTMNDFSEP